MVTAKIGKPNWYLRQETKQMEQLYMNIIAEIKTLEGQSLATFTVPGKEFKTGSRGYYANGKMEIDGKRYQFQIQLVEIGSKKKAEAEE
jgi:hypothetical protein